MCSTFVGLRILVVDDDEDSRRLLENALDFEGAVVATAASVQEALEKIHQEPPQVIISDIKMPVQDGYTLIHELQSCAVNEDMIPVIAVTAYVGLEDRAKVLSAGFQAYLTKPLDLDQLYIAIGRLRLQFYQQS
ncbi:response regulator [Pseudanabaenaceae cyanobacterium LEGE 13415]|nr:response regulator [Pseudanabaenaceae cyanobacterium LEGE 13415]